MVESFILQYSKSQRIPNPIVDEVLLSSSKESDTKQEYFYIRQKPLSSASSALAPFKTIPAGGSTFTFHTPFFRSIMQELYTFVVPRIRPHA